jgi:hypothetical protein
MLEDTPNAPNPNYRSYLIRLWRENEAAPWRASLTHVVTGEIHKFATVEMVFDYLHGELTTEIIQPSYPRLPK